MKEILDLIHVLESVLGYKQDDWDTAMRKLGKNEAVVLEAILSDRKAMEADIANSVLETTDSANYKRYKRKLNSNLSSLLILFTPSEYHYNSFQRNYYLCVRLHATLKILRGLTYHHLAKPIAERLLQLSRKYYFVESRLEACQYLMKHHVSISPDMNRHLEYAKEASRCMDLLRLEHLASERKSHFVLLRLSNKSIGLSADEQADVYLEEFRTEIFPIVDSFKVYRVYYEMGVLKCMMTYDYRGALKYAQDGYKHFLNLPFDHVSAKSGYLSKMAKCYLELGDFDLVIETQLKALEGYKEGGMNWFIAKYQLMAAYLHGGYYDTAFTIYKELIKHRNFKHQGIELATFLRLAGAYLEFLVLVGVIRIDVSQKRFRMKKFLNEVAHYDHDKNRMKISIIVIQLLYNIYDRDYDEMERKIYSLKDFCGRRLVRKSPNFRSNCFIKMLLEVPLNNFNPIAVSRKTEKYLARLSSVSSGNLQAIAEIEVVPYETLWAIIIDHLESPKRKRKSAMNRSMFLVE